MGEWRDEWREVNRANWDERVPIHVSGEFYDVASFKGGQERLQPFEIDEVGDVRGKKLLHLQCHFGIDTLSWARRGARVTGLDFSAPAVEAARGLAKEMGLEATFVHSDVYDAGGATGGRTFDIVYTGRGAIIWLPDIGRWAEVVMDLLKPGAFCTSQSSTLSPTSSETKTSAWSTITSRTRIPGCGKSQAPTPISTPRHRTTLPTNGTTPSAT